MLLGKQVEPGRTSQTSGSIEILSIYLLFRFRLTPASRSCILIALKLESFQKERGDDCDRAVADRIPGLDIIAFGERAERGRRSYPHLIAEDGKKGYCPYCLQGRHHRRIIWGQGCK
jgi:hypothetical protein